VYTQREREKTDQAFEEKRKIWENRQILEFISGIMGKSIMLGKVKTLAIVRRIIAGVF